MELHNSFIRNKIANAIGRAVGGDIEIFYRWPQITSYFNTNNEQFCWDGCSMYCNEKARMTVSNIVLRVNI